MKKEVRFIFAFCIDGEVTVITFSDEESARRFQAMFEQEYGATVPSNMVEI